MSIMRKERREGKKSFGFFSPEPLNTKDIAENTYEGKILLYVNVLQMTLLNTISQLKY